MRRANIKEICWMVVLTILCIICFPINPLVLTGVLEPRYYLASFVLGWAVWAVGMILVMAPIILFPRRGGVPRGKSFVHTTRLVDTGIYAVVRHPQYLGGIMSIFVATLLFYPHWLFAVLGITGGFVVYRSAMAEDRLLVKQFGNEYIEYMKKVPRMNIILGIVSMLKRRQSRNGLRSYNQIEEELQEYKDHLREGLLKYTRKAFQMLPKMENTRILDIGCGSGVPTIELAKLNDGEVTGIDINQVQLDRLSKKTKKAGLSDRLKTANRSMLNMDFPVGSFDIIWAEGSIAVTSFESGLKEWRRLLKAGGFLVVHDDLGNLKKKIDYISQCGYELIDHFMLSNDTWWNEYYAPLEMKLNEMRSKYTDDQKVIAMINGDQKEIDGFRQNPERYRSVFFVMRKSHLLV